MTNTIFIGWKVRGVVREEDGVFIAGFPRLQLFSQGNSAEEAKKNAEDALRLWVESCLERDTLRDALTELGWHLTRGEGEVAEGTGAADQFVVLEDSLGEPWESSVTIPAYQAAELLSANG